MSFLERRQKQRERETNVDLASFDWEVQNIPLLHSGLTEPNPGADGSHMLSLTLYFRQGKYQVRLADKIADEKCFVTINSLGSMLREVNSLMENDELIWTPDRAARTNGRY